MNLLNTIISLTFVACISLPFLGWVVSDDKEISTIEKRKLKQLPGVPSSLSELEIYPEEFENYFKEQFGFRDNLVGWHNKLKARLAISPSRRVLMGGNGWLFYADEGVLDDYRNIELLSDIQLKAFRDDLEAKYYWLKKRGIGYMFVIAPNKHTIYHEYIPPHIRKYTQTSRYDQLVEFMRTSEVPVIDLRQVLIREKGNYRLYGKTDTHWNALGAYIAHHEIVRHLNKPVPYIQPLSIDTKSVKWQQGEGGDLANMLGLSDAVTEERPILPLLRQFFLLDSGGYPANTVITSNPNATKRLLMFRDSFSIALIPYLSEYFKRATYLWTYSNFSLLKKYLESESPDVVIEERTERYLRLVPGRDIEFLADQYREKLNTSTRKIFQATDSMKAKFSVLNQATVVQNSSDNQLAVIATGDDPELELGEIDFSPGKKYIMKIIITAPDTTEMQLFFSDKFMTGYPYSERNSIRYPVNKGRNEVYVLLEYDNLGRRLRLDPGAVPGEYVIEEVEIGEI